MSQIMQITKEKNLCSFPKWNGGEPNQGSFIDHGLDATDMMGLSWLLIEDLEIVKFK